MEYITEDFVLYIVGTVYHSPNSNSDNNIQLYF